MDDKSYIPAAHFQNNFVPRDHACFTCHTDYTMFGDYKAKWRGVHHVWVQYFGKIPKPEDIKLYTPYNNRECLHCHAGARPMRKLLASQDAGHAGAGCIESAFVHVQRLPRHRSRRGNIGRRDLLEANGGGQ